MSNLTGVNANNFQSEVLDEKLPVLVDFWASWCTYCVRLAPIVEEIADESVGKMKVVKLNVDENKGLAQKYGVMSLPTLLLFKEGKEVQKIIGYSPKASIEAKLTPYL